MSYLLNKKTDLRSHCFRDNDIQPSESQTKQAMCEPETTNFQQAYPNVTNNPPNPVFAQVKQVQHLQADSNFELPSAMSHMESSAELVELYPVVRKGPNYLKHCIGFLSENEKPASILDCIRKYTSGEKWFCSTINMALGTDSPTLEKYGEYIRHLKYSIGMSSMHYTGTVFRGNIHLG